MSIQVKTLNQGYGTGECPIVAMEVLGYNPSNMINVVSFADMIHENSDNYNVTVELNKISTSTFFNMKYYESSDNITLDFIVTDKLNLNNQPLYYKYELMFDMFTISGIDDIEVYANNEVLISKSNYNIEYADVSYSNIVNPGDNTNRYGSNVKWYLNNNFATNTATGMFYRIRLLLPLSLTEDNTFYTVRYSKYMDGVSIPNHVELLEPINLYTTNDYNINASKLYINQPGSDISQSSTRLFITRDPMTKIKPLGVFDINSSAFQDSINTSWNLKLSTGSFILNHDKNSSAMYFGLKYIDAQNTSAEKQSIQTIKPKVVGSNIIKINDHSIYLDETDFIYPNYKLKYYSKIEQPDSITGYLNIDINGQDAGIEVSSIDRSRGYMLITSSIKTDDIINVSFTVNNTKTMFIRNVELNPKFTDENSDRNNIWKNTSLYGKKIKNLGIAVRHSSNSNIDTILSDYYYPYLFDFDTVKDDNTVTLYKCNIINGDISDELLGQLIYNPISGITIDPTNEDINNPVSSYFMPICVCSLNDIAPTNAKLTDARRLGGGYRTMNNISPQSIKSISDVGVFDGYAIPTSNTIIIHLPRFKWTEILNRFKNSNMFNYDDFSEITPNERYVLEQSGEELQVSPTQYADYTKVRDEWAETQASLYLDQLIKKYISAGTNYLLLDENFNSITLRN